MAQQFSPTKMQRLRFERGLSREALAETTGVHYWSIQAWERGQHVPRGTSVAALARALSVPYEALLEDEQPVAGAQAATGSRMRKKRTNESRKKEARR